MSFLDDLDTDTQPFPAGQTVIRQRRQRVTDPHDPEHTIAGAWDDAPDEITLEGAYLSTAGSTDTSSATRTQAITTATLFCQPGADVRTGDRVLSIAGGGWWYVNARPESDTNPFTGWQPVMQIPLELTEG